MPDREKVNVFDAFRICITEGKCTNTDCPYEYQCELIRNGQLQFIQIPKVLALDVLALLKEQEAVEPIVSTAEQRCGHCNKVIEMDGWKACPWCGKMIDWKRWWNKNGTHDNT